ncbi:unnamed protein product, partial [Allacma fusca]
MISSAKFLSWLLVALFIVSMVSFEVVQAQCTGSCRNGRCVTFCNNTPRCQVVNDTRNVRGNRTWRNEAFRILGESLKAPWMVDGHPTLQPDLTQLVQLQDQTRPHE